MSWQDPLEHVDLSSLSQRAVARIHAPRWHTACLLRFEYAHRLKSSRWDPAIHTEIKKLFSIIDYDGSHKIGRDDYIAFLHKVYIALIGTPRSEEEETAVEEADWAADSEGKCFINLRRFFRAMFELADVWTLHPSRDEYVHAFCSVHSR